MDFLKLNQSIAPIDESSAREAGRRWDSIAKPVGSLGRLESAVSSIAALTGSARIDIDKRVVAVMCADNGVLAEGVASTPQDITAVMAEFILAGNSCVCKMAQYANADVFPIDIGMVRRVEGVEDRHVANGTKNIAVGSAMTREEGEAAIMTGIDLADRYKAAGYKIVIPGEMGIGNTTTSSAIAAVLLGRSVKEVTGRGAGISDDMLMNKIRVIERAIEVNKPDPTDAFDVLCKLGGFDIAGMVGLYIGCAINRIPIIIDGIISSVAALVAYRLCPNSVCAMLASHESVEPAACDILKELGTEAFLNCEMRLGEGTGAVCMLPVLDMALAVYNNMSTYDDIGLEAFDPDKEEN